jgi:hypothetical protein
MEVQTVIVLIVMVQGVERHRLLTKIMIGEGIAACGSNLAAELIFCVRSVLLSRRVSVQDTLVSNKAILQEKVFFN